MSDAAAIALVVALVTLGSGALFWLMARSGKRRAAERSLEAAEFERRQSAPNLVEVEKHLGHALPASLHALYQDRELALTSGILIGVPNPATDEDECYVAWFEPGDLKNFTANPWPGCEGLFRIGNNGAGDQFLVDPREADPEVIYYLHESARKRSLGTTLSAFINAPRRPVPEE